jgi:hypothetical protein
MKMGLGDEFLTLAYVTKLFPHPTHVYYEEKQSVFLQNIGVPLQNFTIP